MKKFNINVLLFVFVLVAIAGKIVRYTVMYDTLVETGIGHSMLSDVNNDTSEFGITISSSASDEDVSNATDNASFIYSKLNFLNFATTYEHYEILISIIWNILLLIIICHSRSSLDMFQFLFLCLTIAVLNIFDFCLAKEPVQMLYFILMFYILISRKFNDTAKFVLCFLTFILSAFTYRVYYILMAAFMILVFCLYKFLLPKIKKVKLWHIILILMLISISYFVLLKVLNVIYPDAYNEIIRVRLRTSSAASDLRAIFKSENLVVLSIDYILVLIRLLFPVELIRFGPKYAIYVLYQLTITYLVIKNVINVNSISKNQKIALCIYIAFLMGSATFEPDFGSWIRHEAVTFPVFFLLLNSMKEKYYINVFEREKVKE